MWYNLEINLKIMAEKKIDLLQGALAKVQKADDFARAVENVASAIEPINLGIANRVRGILQGGSTGKAERAFTELVVEGKSNAEALGIVLRGIYGRLFEPKNLAAIGLNLDGLVGAYGGSPELRMVLEDLGGAIALSGKSKAGVTQLQTERTAKGQELQDLDRANQQISGLVTLLGTSKDVFGQSGNLKEALEDTKLQKTFYSAFDSLMKLTDAIEGNTTFNLHRRELRVFIKGFIDLMDDKGEKEQLEKEWIVVMKSLGKIKKLVEKDVFKNDPAVNQLAQVAISAVDEVRTSYDLVRIPPNPEALKNVVAFPDFVNEDRVRDFWNFETTFQPVKDWLKSSGLGERPDLKALLEEFEEIKRKNTNPKSHVLGRPEIGFFLGKAKATIDAVVNVHHELFNGLKNAAPDYETFLLDAKKRHGVLPLFAEDYLKSSNPTRTLNLTNGLADTERDLATFETTVERIYPKNGPRILQITNDPNFPVEAQKVQEVKDYLDKMTLEVNKIVAILPSGDPLIAEINKFKTDFAALNFQFPPAHLLAPDLATLNNWLKANYYPLEAKIKNSVASAYIAQREELVEEIKLNDEKLQLMDNPLRAALELLDPSADTDLKLMAALMTKAGWATKVVGSDLRIFDQKLDDLGDPTVRTRIVSKLGKALEKLEKIESGKVKDTTKQLDGVASLPTNVTNALQAAEQVQSKSKASSKPTYDDLNPDLALGDEIARIDGERTNLPAPLDPSRIQQPKTGPQVSQAQLMDEFNNERAIYAQTKGHLDSAFRQLTRVHEVMKESFNNLKTVFVGLDLVEAALGGANDGFPKMAAGYSALRTAFEGLETKEGNLTANDLKLLKDVADEVNKYVQAGGLEKLMDTVKFTMDSVKGFGSNPEGFAKALKAAAYQLVDPGMTAKEASDGAEASLKAEALLATKVLPDDEKADLLNAGKFDVLASEGLKKLCANMVMVRGDKEVKLEAVIGDVGDLNDLGKLAKLVASEKLRNNEWAAVYNGLQAANGNLVSKQMRVIREGLVAKVLENSEVKKLAKANKLSEQQKVDRAHVYVKALIEAPENESTVGFVEGLGERETKQATRNREIYSLEMKFLDEKAAAGEVTKAEYRVQAYKLAKEYEVEARDSFWRFAKGKHKANMNDNLKALGTATPEIIARKTSKWALKTAGFFWNQTAGRLSDKLKVDVSPVADKIGGSAKEIFGRDKAWFKESGKKELALEKMKDKLEDLKKETEEAKVVPKVEDSGLKFADFFKAANDDTELAAAA